ncbi:MAG: 1-aminocyclopropane-1-carboxylate deaminase/D-cysteine desulfhydrase [Candidatus Helarchaeota archaeon]
MPRKSVPLLFEEYPRLEGEIPYVPLIKETPIQKLEALGSQLDANLWIKRDDLTTEIYGGNKPRKLEFVLADALDKRKTNIITMGGTGSNHCLATTIFAKQVGIHPVLILFDQPCTADVQKKLLIFQSLGATLLGPYGELGGLFQYLLFQRFRKNTYFLPAGGSSPLGVLGFVNAAFELRNQLERINLPPPNYLFITCGTLGTMAGLLLGSKLANLNTEIIGVRVVQSIISLYNLTFSFENAVRKLANKTLKLLRSIDKTIPNLKIKEKPRVFHNFLGKGYGFATKEGVEALELVKRHEHITLDTTYTAKTFAALLQFIQEHKKSIEPVLFWNTYNSQDITKFQDDSISYRDLPKGFHKYFIS